MHLISLYHYVNFMCYFYQHFFSHKQSILVTMTHRFLVWMYEFQLLRIFSNLFYLKLFGLHIQKIIFLCAEEKNIMHTAMCRLLIVMEVQRLKPTDAVDSEMMKKRT